ncbi:MAG: helix-turn-helix domain-containing protein [Acidobacteria bacterium]|nr:helix-turn-helix domain-containing protein [Acidobacteriota bacterium]
MATERLAGDFGARLREARERRGLSLRVIADTTRISVRALEALERNDISRLPGGIFSRAFVRAYATEIGLDPEQTVAEFITRFPDETVTQGHPRTRDLVAELDADHDRRRGSGFLRVALIAVPIVLLVLWFAFGRRQTIEPAAQPVAAAPTPAAQAVARRFVVTVRALRTTTFSVAPDRLAGNDVTLNSGESRAFEAMREVMIIPTDPSAIEWSADGLPWRTLTGPTTITPEQLTSRVVLP